MAEKTLKINLKDNKAVIITEKEIFDSNGEFPVFAEKNRRYFCFREKEGGDVIYTLIKVKEK